VARNYPSGEPKENEKKREEKEGRKRGKKKREEKEGRKRGKKKRDVQS
jgi:hypothetical protein